MIDRRGFLTGLCALGLPTAARPDKPTFMLPEWHPHAACIMTWCDAVSIHGHDAVDAIRREQARIAKAIAGFEPVVMLAGRHEVSRARKMCGSSVDVREMAVDDIWARDTMPIVQPLGRTDAVGRPIVEATGWNFNAWGEKHRGLYDADRRLAARYAKEEGLPFRRARIVAEGGAFATDGMGTLLTTETCLLNPNRNPGMSKAEVTAALQADAPCAKVIWLWGSEVDTVTDGHVDGLARFIRPGLVVVEVTDDKEDPEYAALQENAVRLEAERDARGEKLEVVRLNRPRWEEMPDRGANFAPSYVNACFPNGGIVMPRFGDKARDADARRLFQELEPDRRIVQFPIDAIAEAGGGIHCTTMQIPRVEGA